MQAAVKIAADLSLHSSLCLLHVRCISAAVKSGLFFGWGWGGNLTSSIYDAALLRSCHYNELQYSSPPPPPHHHHTTPTPLAPHCVHRMREGGSRGGGGNEKLSILSVYRLYQVGRFLSTRRCRVQSGGNNTFECSAEWATIALVCKQCGPGSGGGHRTQLPRL